DCNRRVHSFRSLRFVHFLCVVIPVLLGGKWESVRPGDERFRKSPQRGQRAAVLIALATMPAIASTGAMLFTGYKGTSGKSALARRTESSTRVANTAVRRQVSGTSDCTSRRDQLLFIELIDSPYNPSCISFCWWFMA